MNFFVLLVIAASILDVGLGGTLPVVDPGLFMIYGVETCRNGSGYCLLGIDCTLDDDFQADDTGGNCNGLKSAFTPAATFTCCQVRTTVEENYFAGESTTPAATTEETPAITESPDGETTSSNVFIDVNNEVFKEVVPPVLKVGNETVTAR